MPHQTFILFCEDCGEKNRVSSDMIKEGRAQFRCTVCEYRNIYPVELPKAHSKQIEEKIGEAEIKTIFHLPRLVSQIESLPDIDRAFFYALSKDKLICSVSSHSKDYQTLSFINRLMASHCAINHLLPSPLQSITLCRGKHLIHYGKLTEKLFLGTLISMDNREFPFPTLMNKIKNKLYLPNKYF